MVTVAGGLFLAAAVILLFSRLAYGTLWVWTDPRADKIGVADLAKIAQDLVVAYRKQRAAETDTKPLTERFALAAEHLGSPNPATRLAGVYAMASVADDWQDQRQQCIDVLCAYLRLPNHPASDGEHPTAHLVEEIFAAGICPNAWPPTPEEVRR